jgi:hypothetical protein
MRTASELNSEFSQKYKELDLEKMKKTCIDKMVSGIQTFFDQITPFFNPSQKMKTFCEMFDLVEHQFKDFQKNKFDVDTKNKTIQGLRKISEFPFFYKDLSEELDQFKEYIDKFTNTLVDKCMNLGDHFHKDSIFCDIEEKFEDRIEGVEDLFHDNTQFDSPEEKTNYYNKKCKTVEANRFGKVLDLESERLRNNKRFPSDTFGRMEQFSEELTQMKKLDEETVTLMKYIESKKSDSRIIHLQKGIIVETLEVKAGRD